MDQEANPHRRSGLTMLAVGWIILFGLVYWIFAGWYERENNPNPEKKLAGQSEQVVLERNRAGYYVAEGEINGRKITFLVDTGATQVALSTRLARELGLIQGAAIAVQTANGTALGFETRLETVRLGPIVMRDVAAVASDGIADGSALLGMSFLKRLEFTQRGAQLILRPAS